MTKKIALILLLLQLPASLLADEKKSVDAKKYPAYEFNFALMNDNPFLNLFGDESSSSMLYTDDDYGQTHGLSLAMSYLLSKGYITGGQERLSVNYNSQLYTQDLTPEGQWDNYFPNNPQLFNEVTTVKVSVDNILARKKFYYVAGVGIGKVNDMDDTGWNAAGQQQRWHDYKHNNLTPETTAMYANQYGDTNEIFGSVKGAVGKIIALSDSLRDQRYEVNQIKLESGAEFISVNNGSNVYFLVEVDRSLIDIGDHSVSAYAGANGIAYASGDKEVLYGGGVNYKSRTFAIATGWKFRSGQSNQDFYKYQDNDPIWSFSISYKW